MKRCKTLLLFALLGAFGAALTLESARCVEAARGALSLCARTLVPTLFPFFVLSSLVVSCLGEALGAAAGGFMRALFGIGGAGGSALALGLLGGYPVGARTAGELSREGLLSRAESEQLLTFCGNCGAGFLLGFCGAGVLDSTRAGAYLFLIHALSAILTGLLLRRRLPVSTAKPRRHSPSLAAAFPTAVTGSCHGMLNVCAFVVLFSVLLSLLPQPENAALRAALFGFFELTGGVAALPPTREGFVLCAAIVSWGGLSVHAQTLAVLENTGLSLRRYFLGKALQTALSIPLALLAAARLY